MKLRSLARWSFMTTGTLFIVTGFWALNALRINMNASESLPDHAYVMWAWPQTVWRGGVIAAEPPAAYADAFAGYFFTKKVVGLPGDIIRHEDGAVCIGTECFPLAQVNGQPFAPPLPEGLIPQGKYAAFGSSADSLDSRYATIGLFDEDKIVTVGFGTNLIPHWKELKAWADARGL